MLQRLGEHISACLDRVKDAETKAAEATDPAIKSDYEELAEGWRILAQSFQFCKSMERLLLDVDRHKAALEHKSNAPDVPEVRCPGCRSLMRVIRVDSEPQNWLTITYHCDACNADTQRTIQTRK